MSKKVVLAYSGGLDTSVILKWLLMQGCEVLAFVADVGQKEDFESVSKKALEIGASEVKIVDLKKEFVTDYIFQALKTNTKYEGRYLLGTALARPLIAKHLVATANKMGTNTIAHGATGKGNDQVRFELAAHSLCKDIEIIAPWREAHFLKQFSGRSDLLAFAKMHHIPVSSTLKKPYSIDANLMHISYEGGDLENPSMAASASICQWTTPLQDTPPDFSTF